MKLDIMVNLLLLFFGIGRISITSKDRERDVIMHRGKMRTASVRTYVTSLSNYFQTTTEDIIKAIAHHSFQR